MIIERSQKIFNACGADMLFVTAPDLMFYLTGFPGAEGCVTVDGNGTRLYTDARYSEAASRALEGSGITVCPPPAGGYIKLAEGASRLAAALSRTTAQEYIALCKAAGEVTDCTSAFDEAMSVKDGGEIASIRKACEIADEAFTDLLGAFKEGMSENDAVAELEYLMRKYGASGTSFDTIA